MTPVPAGFDLDAVRELDLPSVGQLGFIVHDIDDALPRFAACFAQPRWYRLTPSEATVRVRGEPSSLAIDIVIGFSGSLQIELIQMTQPVRNMYSEHLRERGEGLQHLGFFLRDFDGRLARARDAGIDVLQDGEFRYPRTRARYAYLDTRPLCGIVVELVGVESFGVRVGASSELMIRSLTRLGGAQKLPRAF
jgi:hypothetical protein